MDQAAFLPPGAVVSVTASPARRSRRRSSCARSSRRPASGPSPTCPPGWSATGPTSGELIRRLDGAGVDRAFVVGGDAKEPGALPRRPVPAPGDGRHRPSAQRDRDPVLPAGPPDHPRRTSPRGARCEGAIRLVHDHPAVLRPAGHRDLAGRPAGGRDRAARPTSGCRGSPSRSDCWRSAPGSASPTPAGSWSRTAASSRGSSGRAGSTGPTGCSRGSPRIVADPAMGVAGLHVYTFNAVEATERWRGRYLAQLKAGEG